MTVTTAEEGFACLKLGCFSTILVLYIYIYIYNDDKSVGNSSSLSTAVHV